MNIGIACLNILCQSFAFLFQFLLLLPQRVQFLRFDALNRCPGALSLGLGGIQVFAAVTQPFLKGIELEQANTQLAADQQQQSQ